MKPKTYTFLVATNNAGTVRKVRVPGYVLHLLLVLMIVGGMTVIFGVGSYSRMLWKVGNYNTLQREQESLKKQYQQLQTTVTDTNQRLSSLQSLATEVAMTYGFMRLRNTPFGPEVVGFGSSGAAGENGRDLGERDFRQAVAQYDYLRKNPTALALATEGLRLMPQPGLGDAAFTPSLWPVLGHISGGFGERLDPFSGEGAFHTGVDISSDYGAEVRVSADGVVVTADTHSGYGRLVVVDHGFGISTWYGHLSGYNTRSGARVKRGQTIGFVGVSGRVTGPHVHYEVRINGAPVNPWRYLRYTSSAD